MARDLCIYVDVDDTLVRSAGSKRIPIPSVIQHIIQLHSEGAVLYCWSSGGADYARQTADELGVTHCFAGFLPKPQVIIDDQQIAQWPEFLHIHPSSCRTLDEYADTLRTSRDVTSTHYIVRFAVHISDVYRHNYLAEVSGSTGADIRELPDGSVKIAGFKPNRGDEIRDMLDQEARRGALVIIN
ncbi:MAG TPA: hypothetical protein VH188_05930 [Chthoniobacterales bacterium]|jgi:hypothetical protein|nr:hypothetical protein [Chthoniobacterales bacterium]